MSNSTHRFSVVSPIDGQPVLSRDFTGAADVEAILDSASRAQREWRNTPLTERIALLVRLVGELESVGADVAAELTTQMGRPIRFAEGEVRGFADRARTMLDLAPDALAPIEPEAVEGFERFIERVPLGVVLVLAPWNYPLLTAVNAVVPALAAGNAVVLKHSDQTPLCAERMVEAGIRAGLPSGVFNFVHLTHPDTARLVRDSRVSHVAFTGSVDGGRAVVQAASERFVGVGLELGGKDPAYVRPDADVAFAAENIVEGVLFNSGQSCCGVERVYVHEAVWETFIDAAVESVSAWTLGDPRDPATMLGPVVRERSADLIRSHVDEAMRGGAWGLIDPAPFADAMKLSRTFVAPQLLVEVNHSMRVMSEETFGPVAGIMRVSSDAEALRHMNDSRYGLTASIWTRDLDSARDLGRQIDTGTVFMNRCDYLDPHLAWTGVKDSGRGCTLSRVGYEHLTRPKSFHLRK